MFKGIALFFGMLLGFGAGLAAASDITVISREDGSGTRGAFVELFKIQTKTPDGKTVDNTVDSADITNSTSVMMTSVANNPNAIGYISLGSLNDKVRALEIDGVSVSVDNIKNGSYTIARPFNIATGAKVTPAGKNFIDFTLSAEGQAIVEKHGYISSVDKPQPFKNGRVGGKVVVSGSSSVTPVMEKLKEAYVALNPDANIEIQLSDSTTGLRNVISGIAEIGMASRAIKASELEQGIKPTVIAIDGIAVIVSNDSKVKGLKAAQVKDIYSGDVTSWSKIQ